eukprot:8811923-Pyramimonas_sp.AAC.1
MPGANCKPLRGLRVPRTPYRNTRERGLTEATVHNLRHPRVPARRPPKHMGWHGGGTCRRQLDTSAAGPTARASRTLSPRATSDKTA